MSSEEAVPARARDSRPDRPRIRRGREVKVVVRVIAAGSVLAWIGSTISTQGPTPPRSSPLNSSPATGSVVECVIMVARQPSSPPGLSAMIPLP